MYKVKEIYQNVIRTTVFKNMVSLGFIQVANYLIPIIIIPYVVRVLGVDFFGKASYAQNIVTYLTILVNYGFEYSATQDVALNKNNKEKLNSIFWTVIKFKLLLLITSFLVLAVLYFSFSKVKEDFLLYIYAALINIGFVLFPTWFFQGIEKMGNMALFNFIIKVLGAILILLMINSASDYKLYLLILSLSYVVVGVFSLFYVVKKYHLSFDYWDSEFHFSVIKKGFPIFLNNIFNTLYALVGLTIIGLYLTDKDIGLYAGVQKIIMAVVALSCMPISISLFPLMSRKFDESQIKGWLFFKQIFVFITIFAVIVALTLYGLSPLLVKLFLGNSFLSVVPVLKILSLVPLLVIIATTLTVLGIYALKMQRFAPFIGAISGGVSLLLCLIIIPKYGIIGASFGWIAAQVTEIIIVSALILYYKKNNF